VKLLLENKDIDVNGRDFGGRTALLEAMEEQTIETVKLLLRHKDIDVTVQDNVGGQRYWRQVSLRTPS
jgi:ankyrin repeat protein